MRLCLFLPKEFRRKGGSTEKTPQLLDSLETVSCGCVCFCLRSLGGKEALLKPTPHLLDSLEIVSCGRFCFCLRSLGGKEALLKKLLNSLTP